MAAQGLDAAEREHETARRIANSPAIAHRARHIEGQCIFPAREADAIAGIDGDKALWTK